MNEMNQPIDTGMLRERTAGPMPAPLLVTVKQACRMLGISRTTLYHLWSAPQSRLHCARFQVVFPRIKENPTRPSIASVVRDKALASPTGSFLRRKDFEGSDRAVESALSRLSLAGELVRVRRGLYYRGKPTRFGMTRPSLLEAAIAVGGTGSGPAGVSAAHLLGLTTQVPGIVEVAVPGKVPDPMPGVRFRLRPFERRELRLQPIEVAVIEVMRDPGSIEDSVEEIRQRLTDLIRRGAIRGDVIAAEIADERHVGARERWRSLEMVA